MTDAARARLRVQAPLLAIAAAASAALALAPSGGAHGAMHGGHRAPLPLLAEAALMFAAMMVPLGGAAVRHVRDRGLARRRGRAVALLVAGYAPPWVAATAVLLAAAAWIAAARSAAVLALAVLAVTLWQCSPLKQLCLNRCHAHPPLAAFGPRADLDVLRFGWSHAGWCIGSCWALMLPPMLLGRGHLVAMAAVTLWLAGERLDKPARPRWRLRGPVNVVRIANAQARLWLRRFERQDRAPAHPRGLQVPVPSLD